MKSLIFYLHLLAFTGCFFVISCKDDKNLSSKEEVEPNPVDSTESTIPILSDTVLTKAREKRLNRIREKNANTITKNSLMAKADFDFTLFDAGTIKRGKVIKKYFPFTNSGDVPLVVSAVRPSCGCTVSSFPQKPVMPGKRDSVLLELNTLSLIGESVKTATFEANIVSPITLILKATVK